MLLKWYNQYIKLTRFTGVSQDGFYMSANFCGKCGGAVQNGVCTNCSAQIEVQPVMQQANYYPQQLQQVYAQQAYQQVQAQPQPVYNQADQEGMFISPDEKVMYQMGAGYAQMFLAGGESHPMQQLLQTSVYITRARRSEQ